MSRDDAGPLSDKDLPVFTSRLGRYTVTYRLANSAQRAMLVILWLMILAAIFVQYWTSVGWDNFGPVAYPGFTILSLAATYCLSIWFFNRRTITISDTAFAVRHGPIPFPLPADREQTPS